MGATELSPLGPCGFALDAAFGEVGLSTASPTGSAAECASQWGRPAARRLQG